MSRLAEALLPLIADDAAEAVRAATERLDQFVSRFEQMHLSVMRAKLGLARQEEADGALVQTLLALLAAHSVDYTLFFRRLSAAAGTSPSFDLMSLFHGDEGPFCAWAEAWCSRMATESSSADARAASMRRANPAFIPRNHRVEEAIEAAVRRGDFQPFETLLEVLGRPYDDQPDHAHLADPPGPEQRAYKTFCGT